MVGKTCTVKGFILCIFTSYNWVEMKWKSEMHENIYDACGAVKNNGKFFFCVCVCVSKRLNERQGVIQCHRMFLWLAV